MERFQDARHHRLLHALGVADDAGGEIEMLGLAGNVVLRTSLFCAIKVRRLSTVFS
jgi:hypothetical protein